MKKLHLLLTYTSALFLLSLSGYASSDDTKNTTITEQFRSALLCQLKPFAIEDKKIIAELEKQKITIKNKKQDSITEIEYHFEQPIKVKNVWVNMIRYESDNFITSFYAKAKGDMHKFAKLIEVNPILRSCEEPIPLNDTDIFRKEITPITDNNLYPDTIVIGQDKDSKPDEFYFICSKFDAN
ncbi:MULTISPECIES: hypothetical protein [unclassified Gilliamella]|uniref:hypothetical protein n=1 Tax=unclassified Gilliamella TaxID=2685620 RepID=UPI00226A026A|nr:MULTISPECIES: hypothetical protein [unclassified Gilliamella]MCX8601723.1 hypothetical protein [Gilliamella sp. B3722]MCX8608381.1 hypothetical protein [Gilliamella sp. B3771]MCX8610986.1 hypothetical protein [Gilliamella sp. B3891]MCX8613454.1 hypothetical protein [Gilliamella sp. B3773]MCX8616368.1 hypothetical protein [Gilliamella sp. B3770]